MNSLYVSNSEKYEVINAVEAIRMTLSCDKLADKLLEVSSRLSMQCRAKEKSPYWECWSEEMMRSAERWSADVDSACCLIVRDKLTEPPCPEVCAFLLLRFHVAADVLSSLDSTRQKPTVIAFPKPLAEMEDSQVSEWLLVDFWHALGSHLWASVGYWEPTCGNAVMTNRAPQDYRTIRS